MTDDNIESKNGLHLAPPTNNGSFPDLVKLAQLEQADPTPDLPVAGQDPAERRPSIATKTHKFDEESWEGALWAKADPKDCPPNIRAANKKALAGAIVHMIKNTGKCRLRAFGPYAEHKANWALTIARGILATYGYDLYWYTCVIEAEINGKVLNGGLGYITVFAD